MTQMLHALMRIFMVFVRFVRARASTERIAEVYNINTEQEKINTIKPANLRGEITFDQVSFSYAGSGGEPVLQDISFTCKAGEMVGIIGPTGCGKTTLINLIPKLYQTSQGYNTWLGRGGVNLSGGQRQRLTLARALLKNPAILILDDSTSALDAIIESKIRHVLKQKQSLANTTILLIFQRISSVMGADQILVLNEGHLV